jgi:hypothetical protein
LVTATLPIVFFSPGGHKFQTALNFSEVAKLPEDITSFPVSTSTTRKSESQTSPGV